MLSRLDSLESLVGADHHRPPPGTPDPHGVEAETTQLAVVKRVEMRFDPRARRYVDDVASVRQPSLTV